MKPLNIFFRVVAAVLNWMVDMAALFKKVYGIRTTVSYNLEKYGNVFFAGKKDCTEKFVYSDRVIAREYNMGSDDAGSRRMRQWNSEFKDALGGNTKECINNAGE